MSVKVSSVISSSASVKSIMLAIIAGASIGVSGYWGVICSITLSRWFILSLSIFPCLVFSLFMLIFAVSSVILILHVPSGTVRARGIDSEVDSQ